MITHNRRKLERGYFLWPLSATAHASGLVYAALLMNRPGVGAALVLCGFLLGLVLGVAAYRILRNARRRESVSATDPYITLVDNLPVGICRSNRDGKFLMANPAFARLFGYSSVAELICIPVSELYRDPADRAALIQEVLEKGEVVRREVLMRRKTVLLFGSRLLLRSFATPRAISSILKVYSRIFTKRSVLKSVLFA